MRQRRDKSVKHFITWEKLFLKKSLILDSRNKFHGKTPNR